ncbi:hypothetical protein [Aquimonas sp.]|uniref:hypothetical protein n=1 Tax=Aquimonas sp. TaxID=1872588 RepID=UPI0037BEAC96
MAAPQPTQWVNRALLFLHGAIHACYADTLVRVLQGHGALGCATQREVSRGFFNAFLRWQVLGESAYRPFFSHDLSLPCPSTNSVQARQQSRAFGPRVLDDFQNGLCSQNALGGALSETNPVLSEGAALPMDSFAPLPGLHDSVPHDRGAMLVRRSGNALAANAPHSQLPFAHRNVAAGAIPACAPPSSTRPA